MIQNRSAVCGISTHLQSEIMDLSVSPMSYPAIPAQWIKQYEENKPDTQRRLSELRLTTKQERQSRRLDLTDYIVALVMLKRNILAGAAYRPDFAAHRLLFALQGASLRQL